MKKMVKRIVASVSALSILLTYVLTVIAAAWIDPETDIRSPITVKQVPVNISDVTMSIDCVCYDLQGSFPTSAYTLNVNGVNHNAMCVAAQHYTPGEGGKAYRMDVSGLSGCRGGNSHLLEASANMTASDGTYTVWADAFYCSDLYQYNDEEIIRKIAWLVNDGSWTYYPLARTYTADEGDRGIDLDFDHPITESRIYRDLTISRDALNRYHPFNIPGSRFGADISGLYGAAHAIVSRMVSGERYHLSGTIYYSFTRTESDKATYTKGSHAAYAYGDNGNGNRNYTFRKIQLMQYMNIIAHAPEYEGDLYIYSPDRRSGEGQQWLMYIDSASDYVDQKAYVRPAIDKNTASDNPMTGAEFTVYSDAQCSEQIGSLTDEDGDGIYSDYSSYLEGEDEREGLIHLHNSMNGTHTFTCYVKETKAPSEFLCSDGTSVSITTPLIDNSSYKVDYSFNYSSRTLSTVVSSGSGTVYSSSSSYDGINDPGNAYIGNNAAGDFTDGAGLGVIKESNNGFTVANTVFKLYEGTGTDTDPLGYYMYTDGWSWYLDRAGSGQIGAAYPIAPDTQYTIVEEYSCDTYGDTSIQYSVRNVSDWSRIGTNRYSYQFDTSGLSSGDVMTITAVNDRETSTIRIVKSADDGCVANREFEVRYLGAEAGSLSDEGVLAGSITTDGDGIAIMEGLPLGWYTVGERRYEGYRSSWQEGTNTRGDLAIVHLTDGDNGIVTVGAVNNVSTKIAVIKRDSWTGNIAGGAVFALYRDEDSDGVLDDDERMNCMICSDSDNDGYVIFEGVGIGDYIISETSAPAGYYRNEDLWQVTVTGLPSETVNVGGEEISAYVVDVSDEPYAAPVFVYKRDSNDDSILLTGAHFDIYEDTNGDGSYEEGIDEPAEVMIDGTRYQVLITERNGRYETVIDNGGLVRADLHYGTYFVVETVAPEMYERSQEVMTVIIGAVDTEDLSEPVPVVMDFVNDLNFGTVLNGISDTKILEYSECARLVDTVSYTNLIAGRTYTLNGELFIRNDDGEAVRTGITGVTTFTVPDDGTGVMNADGTVRVNGNCDVVFTFDSTVLSGETIVAFETLKYRTRTVAVHTDINDESQTVYVPEILTELTDELTGTHTVSRSASATLVDTVSYSNLIPGTEYRITGILVDKDSGESITGTDGEPVSSETVFTPDSPSGIAEITFVFDSVNTVSSEIVAFEDLWFEDNKIAVHADINDDSQTVGVPELITRASGTNGNKTISIDQEAEVIDTVRYTNLTAGETYIISGQLMDAATGEPFLAPDDQIVTSTVVFVPESSDGVVEVPFTFDASGLDEGDRIVVFEEAYAGSNGEILICEHKDVDNQYQTVTFGKQVPKTGDDGIDAEYITGLMASLGVIISVIGIGSVMDKSLGRKK